MMSLNQKYSATGVTLSDSRDQKQVFVCADGIFSHVKHQFENVFYQPPIDCCRKSRD